MNVDFSSEVTVDFRAVASMTSAMVDKRIEQLAAYTWRAARNSMRHVGRISARTGRRGKKYGIPAPAGTPPRVHHLQGLRPLLGFEVDRQNQRAFVGYMNNFRFGRGPDDGGKTIGRIMEFGGTKTNRNRFHPTVVLGGTGILQANIPGFGIAENRASNIKTIRHPALKVNGGSAQVVYGKIRTSQQRDRAIRINEVLWGSKQYQARYPARPAVSPALKAAVQRKMETSPEIYTGARLGSYGRIRNARLANAARRSIFRG